MYEDKQAMAQFFELKMCSHFGKEVPEFQKFKELIKLQKPKRQRRKPVFTQAEIKRLGNAATEAGCRVASLKKGDVTIELATQPQVNETPNEWDEIIFNNEGKW